MTATVAPSAAPPWAIRVWADDLNIYAEIASLNQPCVITVPISEGGLSRILSILGAKHSSEAAGEPYLRPAIVAKEMMREGLTQRDLDLARQSLKSLGILK